MNAAAKATDEIVKTHSDLFLGCLRGAFLFARLSDQEIGVFQAAAQIRSYKKGKILYLEKETAEFFYVICEGWVKLFHTMPEGEEVILDMLTSSNTVGESAVFEHGHHTSSAQVIEDARVLSIPAKILKDQIRRSPTLAAEMLAAMSRHHRYHYSQIALNAMQSAPQRIGCFLLRLCPKDKKKDIVFHLPYDKGLIADTLGMKSPTFSRALHILRQKTGIRITGTRVEIESAEQLTSFVYGSLATQYIAKEGK